MEAILDFFLNWLVLPLIILYGFVSWCREHPDTKFWNSPYDEESPQDKNSDDSADKKE